jgi:hypothetical protein
VAPNNKDATGTRVFTNFTVFHGNSLETPHYGAGSMAPGYREVDQNSMQEAGQFVGYGLEGNGFGNANVRIEDLGQFWLWDIGP